MRPPHNCSIIATIVALHAVIEAQTAEILFQSDLPGDQEGFVMEGDGSNLVRLINDPPLDTGPRWSPDGLSMVFYTDRDGNFEVYSMDADGSNQTNLTNHVATDLNASWSPDGTKVIFQTDRNAGTQQVFIMDADGSNQTLVSDGSGNDSNPTNISNNALTPHLSGHRTASAWHS